MGLWLLSRRGRIGDAVRQRGQEARDGPNAAGKWAQPGALTSLALCREGQTDGFEEASPFSPAEGVQNPRAEGVLAYFIPVAKQLFKGLKDV